MANDSFWLHKIWSMNWKFKTMIGLLSSFYYFFLLLQTYTNRHSLNKYTRTYLKISFRRSIYGCYPNIGNLNACADWILSMDGSMFSLRSCLVCALLFHFTMDWFILYVCMVMKIRFELSTWGRHCHCCRFCCCCCCCYCLWCSKSGSG